MVGGLDAVQDAQGHGILGYQIGTELVLNNSKKLEAHGLRFD